MNGKDIVRRVAIGSDQGSFRQKETVRLCLEANGYRVVDVGCHDGSKVDYPDIALAVCRKVVSGDCERGIVIDCAGIGSCIAANKVKGIRAATCHDLKTVINSREHNDANVLALSGAAQAIEDLCVMAKAWLETPFAGGRHTVRVNKIIAMERGGFGA